LPLQELTFTTIPKTTTILYFNGYGYLVHHLSLCWVKCLVCQYIMQNSHKIFGRGNKFRGIKQQTRLWGRGKWASAFAQKFCSTNQVLVPEMLHVCHWDLPKSSSQWSAKWLCFKQSNSWKVK